MIDFHTHILPGIDDGARTYGNAIELIQEEVSQGIDTIVLTPHFDFEKKDLSEFLAQRDAAYAELKRAVKERRIPVQLHVGAEVRFSPRLLDADIAPLCVEGSRYILVEFPMSHTPSATREVFYSLMTGGYFPILAHAERYNIENKSNYLYNLVCSGVLMQVNYESAMNHRKKKVAELIKHDMVHLWGSDTHSMDKRPPSFARAKRYLDKKFGTGLLEHCNDLAKAILGNQTVMADDPIAFKKSLFGG